MVASWKTEEVKTLAGRISKSKVVGLVEITGLPSKQFQKMRKTLKDVELQITRNNLIKLALDKAGKDKAGLKELQDYVEGPTGLLFTTISPFKLQKLLDKNKSTMPAKPGSAAPYDIVIPAGDTPFAPGPIIGELQKVGIKAQIQSGKIVVKEDSLVVRKGDKISGDLASILARLGIEPVEISLRLGAVYEDGMIYSGDVLRIDEVKTRADLQQAYLNALNLSYNARIYTKDSIKLMLFKAFSDARSLAISKAIVSEDTVKELLALANQQMMALAGESSGDAAAAAPQTTISEDKKKDEKPKDEDVSAGLAALFG